MNNNADVNIVATLRIVFLVSEMCSNLKYIVLITEHPIFNSMRAVNIVICRALST